MTGPELESVESPPKVHAFRITPVGGVSVIAEGNDRFCHAHEVRAYMAWAKERIMALQHAPLTEEEKQ